MSNSSLVTKNVPAYTGNYTAGRQGNKIDKIVIHHAASTSLDSIGQVFQQVGRNASAHYGVGGNQIHQYVNEDSIAWHASNWSVNCTSVGIETTNSTGRVNNNDSDPGSWKVADDTLNTLIRLVADVSKRNGLGTLKVGVNLCYHSMYAATFCPGNYLRSKLQYIVDKANEINGGEITSFKKGDLVTSTAHGYAASDGSGAKSIIVTTPTVIDKYNAGSKYPYHIKNIGWFRAEDLVKSTTDSMTLKVGDKVRVKSGAKDWNGVPLADFVYSTVYDVLEVKGDRIVIGLGKDVTCAINKNDLIKQ